MVIPGYVIATTLKPGYYRPRIFTLALVCFMPTKDLAPFSIHTPQKPSCKPINEQFIVAGIC